LEAVLIATLGVGSNDALPALVGVIGGLHD